MNDITDNMKQNIILHLQCKSSDLDDNKFNIDNKIDYQPNISDPKAFNLNNNKMLNLNFETLSSENTKKPQDENINNPFHKDFTSNNSMQNNEILSNNIIIKNNSIAETKTDEGDKRQIHLKQIWDKLNKLQKNLKYNNVSDKRSACFGVRVPLTIQLFIYRKKLMNIIYLYMDVFAVQNVRLLI